MQVFSLSLSLSLSFFSQRRVGENVHKFRSFRVPAGLRVVWPESAVLGRAEMS